MQTPMKTKAKLIAIVWIAMWIGVISVMTGCKQTDALKSILTNAPPADVLPTPTSIPIATPTATPDNSAANLFGKIEGLGEESENSFFSFKKLNPLLEVSALSVCEVKVYELAGSEVIANGTADDDGTFVIQGGNLEAGRAYKVIGECGQKKYTAILGADNSDPEDKTPADVGAHTTLASVEIVKSIVTALQSATEGLSESDATLFIEKIMAPENVNKLVASLSSTIQTAVDSGSMQLPSDEASASMAEAIAQATIESNESIENAENLYKNDPALQEGEQNYIPMSVQGAVKGAAASVASFPACDRSFAEPFASEKQCIASVAKMMFNMIHFDVAVLKEGGAFGNVKCANNDPVLSAAFPNANIIDGGTDPVVNDEAFCGIHSALASVDRNRSYSSGGGGQGDNGPLFSETGGTVTVGVLSAMGKALFSGYEYKISDIDSFVFASHEEKGGMNARLIYKKENYTFPPLPINGGNYQYQNSDFFLLSHQDGVTSLDNSSLPDGQWPSDCNQSPCDPYYGDVFSFSGLGWDTARNHSALAIAIGASNWGGTSEHSVFLKSFGGTIPTQAQLHDEIVNSKVHRNYNRTGQAQFFVLYSQQPNWNDPNCQWGTTPTPWLNPVTNEETTECIGVDGSIAPLVTVDVVTGAPDEASGLSQITQINLPEAASAGRYYLYPIQNYGSFMGILQLLNARNGRMMTDELFNQRYVQVILDSNQCRELEISDPNCGVGKIYNVNAFWECNGNCTLVTTLNDAQKATAINSNENSENAFALEVQYRVNMVWSSNVNESGYSGPGRVGVGTDGNSNHWQPMVLTVFEDGTLRSAEVGTADSNGEYSLSQYWSCPRSEEGSPVQCTPDGFYLANSEGEPHSILNTKNLHPQLSVYEQGPCGFTSCPANVIHYTEEYLNSVGVDFFPNGDGGRGQFAKVATNPVVNMGPAKNPTYDCSLDPFYADENNNQMLDSVLDQNGKTTCLEPSFNSSWDAGTYVNGDERRRPVLEPHPDATIALNVNAYQYGDPQGITALLNTAFGPWLDGSHTLDGNTHLNTLQAFSLLYVFMDGNIDFKRIDGVLPDDGDGIPRNTFQILSPMFTDSKMTLSVINDTIGKAFLNYRQ